MRRSLWFGSLLVLVLSTPAAACPSCSASSLCCLPGFGMLGMHVGFALAVLAGFLERPFLSLAGVREGALAYALQANLVSSLSIGVLGLMTMFVPIPGGGDGLLVLWIIMSLVLSAALEYAYLAFRQAQSEDRALGFGWILLGNLVSAGVIFTVPIIRPLFGTDTYRYLRMIQPHRELIAMLTFIACIVVFAIAWAKTPKRATASMQRGFEVIAPAAGFHA